MNIYIYIYIYIVWIYCIKGLRDIYLVVGAELQGAPISKQDEFAEELAALMLLLLLPQLFIHEGTG